MADAEGFEPPRRFSVLSAFKADPFSQTWVSIRMVTLPRLELGISGLKGRCPDRLDYSAIYIKRIKIMAEPGRFERPRAKAPICFRNRPLQPDLGTAPDGGENRTRTCNGPKPAPAFQAGVLPVRLSLQKENAFAIMRRRYLRNTIWIQINGTPKGSLNNPSKCKFAIASYAHENEACCSKCIRLDSLCHILIASANIAIHLLKISCIIVYHK